MKKLDCKKENCRKIEENPVMILNSIARLFDAKARASGVFPEALPHSSRRLLRLLARKDGISQIELVEMTHLSKPTVSLALKKMEEMGFVKRECDEKDARISKVYLTERGKALDEQNFNTLQEIDRFVMRGLSEDEIKKVTEILLKMRENLLSEDTDK
ncbi:MAG: MarR family transcriptional regulator [Clostridia bacterium]|nr:MarR family transcriptional regulator [Clostridia bacterium]